MNIHNKNWAQYEYSYNLANSRENWAQKIATVPPLAPRSKFYRATPPLNSKVNCRTSQEPHNGWK